MSTNNAINNTLPTPFTVGATSVTSTGTQLNLLNGLTAVPIDKIVTQTFTASGTYTPTTGMVYCKIEILGAGGAGGGAPTASGVTASAGSGGGAGGYSFAYFTAATIGASQSVTIGAGGTGVLNGNGNTGAASSVGALISANGGAGGFVFPAFASISGGNGGTGASVPAGSFNKFPGNDGSPSVIYPPSGGAISGTGASSSLAGGAFLVTANGGTQSTGNAALANTGAGGSGSAIFGATGTTSAGGNGGSGIVIITEFVSA